MEIKLQNIEYKLDKLNYKEKIVFEKLNLNFKKEKINVIISKNSEGKTTLLDLITLNTLPTKGTIKYDNFTHKQKDEFINKIGYVEQNTQFITDSVLEELEYTIDIHNYNTKNKQKRIMDVLIMVHLDGECLNKKINNLSKSEKKKLSLALSLIYNPDTLILDNPTNSLDSKGKNELLKLIRMLKTRYNKTIIIASNDIDFVHKLADYVYVLNDKNIVLKGDKYEIFKDVDTLNKYGIDTPNVIKFSDMVLKKKNIKIGYRDEINDLIKDIYRYVK